MIIANKVKEYSSSCVFLMKESNVEEIKATFKDHDFKDKADIEELNTLLIEDGTTDEEIIEAVLERREGNFIVEFIDERNNCYFKVFELQDDKKIVTLDKEYYNSLIESIERAIITLEDNPKIKDVEGFYVGKGLAIELTDQLSYLKGEK